MVGVGRGVGASSYQRRSEKLITRVEYICTALYSSWVQVHG